MKNSLGWKERYYHLLILYQNETNQLTLPSAKTHLKMGRFE